MAADYLVTELTLQLRLQQSGHDVSSRSETKTGHSDATLAGRAFS